MKLDAQKLGIRISERRREQQLCQGRDLYV